MSTSVGYKGSTIATVSNTTKTLNTSGKWLEDDITVTDSGGSSATQHSIYLEFTDSTNTTIPVYYDDSAVGAIIASSKPTTISSKTVSLAKLDNVTWYELTIPIGVELVDYLDVVDGVYIGSDGEEHSNEWSVASDYIEIDPTMTFSYTSYYWYYIGFYDSNKDFIDALYVMEDGTADPNDGNTGYGTIGPSKIPSGSVYARLCGSSASSSKLSLIRTA